MVATICSIGTDVINTALFPLVAISAVATAMIIALGYMLGEAIHNPKVSLWAKTEIIQLFISVAAAVLILGFIPTFCSVNLNSILQLLNPAAVPPGSVSIFEGAERYLSEAGQYIHDVEKAARYHLGAYNIMEAFGRLECGPFDSGSAFATVGNIFFCLFGNVFGVTFLVGGSGVQHAPDSGYAMAAPALQIAFNATVFAYLSTFNYLFILHYIYSGFVFFFLPLGIFLRAMPYLRTLGSLLMSLAFCFIVVYPLVLSFFYLDFIRADSILKPPFSPALAYYVTADISNAVGIGQALDNSIKNDVFPYLYGDQSFELIKLAGNAFLIGIFIPTFALLAAVAGVAYLNRFLGEEIDLSRVVQMI